MFLLWRHAESKRKLAEKESRIAGVERTRAEAQRIRAEAERTRAEADLEVARVALYEFSMLIGDQSKLKKMVESRAALIPFYQQLRLRLAGVATRWPEHLLIHSQLAWMDHGLANLLREQERLDEARAFFESSLANWDKVVSAAPEHPGWSSHRLITLEAFALLIVEQGRLAIEDGKIEQGAGYLAQAVAEYELRNLQPTRVHGDRAGGLPLEARRTSGSAGRTRTSPGRCLKSPWRTGTGLSRRILRIPSGALAGSVRSKSSHRQPLSKGG